MGCIVVFFVAFIALGKCSPSVHDCPVSVQSQGLAKLQVHGSLCYQFELTSTVHFTAAKGKCEHNGGVLVVVDSKAVNDFLVDKLQNVYRYTNKVWIGLQDEGSEHRYIWEDGTLLSDTGYTNWADREGGAGGLHLEHYFEDCIAMDPAHDGIWYDFKCQPGLFDLIPVVGHYDYKPYICQFPLLPTTAVTTTTARPTTPTQPTTTPSTSTTSTTTTKTTSLVTKTTKGPSTAKSTTPPVSSTSPKSKPTTPMIVWVSVTGSGTLVGK